jgi:hypothetical protein
MNDVDKYSAKPNSVHSIIGWSLADRAQHLALFYFSLHHVTLVELLRRKQHSKWPLQFLTGELIIRHFFVGLSPS